MGTICCGVHVEGRGQLASVILSLSKVGPRDQTQIFKLGGKGLLPTELFHKLRVHFLKSYATDLNPGVSLELTFRPYVAHLLRPFLKQTSLQNKEVSFIKLGSMYLLIHLKRIS